MPTASPRDLAQTGARPAQTGADRVVLGADIGGTSTRVAVARTDGTVLATAAGGPGNPNVVGLEASTTTVRSVCDEALTRAGVARAGETGAGEGGVQCVAAALGLAGVTQLRGTPAAESWTRAVLPDVGSPVRLCSDFAVAFSSATDAVRGVAAITGTGAGAMLIDAGEDVARRDAWGWLLGDEGSGFWIGREAMRATLAAAQAGRRSPLADAVRESLGVPVGSKDPTTELLQRAYAMPPRDLADLAPLVADLSTDPTAASILSRATASVVDRILDLTRDELAMPIVLTGSVATGNGPLAAPVRDALVRAQRPHVLESGDGLLGALWLALTTHRPRTEPLPRWSDVFGSLGEHRS